MEVGSHCNAPAALPPTKGTRNHHTGSRGGLRASLGGCGKYHPNQDSTPDGPAHSKHTDYTSPAHTFRNNRNHKFTFKIMSLYY